MMPLWKATLQRELCLRIISEMENPEHPHALILYRNALADERAARKPRQAKAAPRDELIPAAVEPAAIPEPVPESVRYLTAQQAAVYLSLSYSTFRKRATRIRRCPQTGRYLRSDLDEYAASLRPKRKR